MNLPIDAIVDVDFPPSPEEWTDEKARLYEEEMNRRFDAAGNPTDLLDKVLKNKLHLDDAAIAALFGGLRRGAELPPQAHSIYLDMNHWIYLTQARNGHEDGKQYGRCLNLLVEAVAAELVILPISSSHYTEVGQISDLQRRSNVCNLIAELSHLSLWRHVVVASNANLTQL